MTPIQVGDRVVIAGTHFAAGREGNVSYVGQLFDREGARVCLADDEDCAPFIEVGSGAWLVKLDGSIVMPAHYVIVPTAHLTANPVLLKLGDMVRLPECAGRWSHLLGVIARVSSEMSWIKLPDPQLRAWLDTQSG